MHGGTCQGHTLDGGSVEGTPCVAGERDQSLQDALVESLVGHHGLVGPGGLTGSEQGRQRGEACVDPSAWGRERVAQEHDGFEWLCIDGRRQELGPVGTPWPGIVAVAGAEWQGLAGVCTLVAKQQDQHILQDIDQHALVELDGQHTCDNGVVLQQLDPEDTG